MNPVVLSSLVPRLIDKIRIFLVASNFRLKLRPFCATENKENLPEFRIFSSIYAQDCLRKQFFCDFRESGGNTKILISLFFAFSVLFTVWMAEIAVFSKIWRKNSVFKISEKRCLQKVKI